jgi:hypothetical protein
MYEGEVQRIHSRSQGSRGESEPSHLHIFRYCSMQIRRLFHSLKIDPNPVHQCKQSLFFANCDDPGCASGLASLISYMSKTLAFRCAVTNFIAMLSNSRNICQPNVSTYPSSLHCDWCPGAIDRQTINPAKSSSSANTLRSVRVYSSRISSSLARCLNTPTRLN